MVDAVISIGRGVKKIASAITRPLSYLQLEICRFRIPEDNTGLHGKSLGRCPRDMRDGTLPVVYKC